MCKQRTPKYTHTQRKTPDAITNIELPLYMHIMYINEVDTHTHIHILIVQFIRLYLRRLDREGFRDPLYHH